MSIMQKTVRMLVKSKVFNLPRSIAFQFLANRNLIILYYGDAQRAATMELIRQTKKETEMLLNYNEAYQIFMLAKRTAKIPGAIAEVGVYKGGSARLICEAKGERELHLFDTFDGLPELHENDDHTLFHAGRFVSSFEGVKRYLNRYPNVYVYKGLFPDTATPIKKKKFSFVNLDVDIYESTLNCLKFFYPRMNKGGIILSHDYIDSSGVRKAFDEFFKNKPETIVEMSGSQCMVIKR